MAVGVEVPVVAVMHQSLRRNLALRDLVPLVALVGNAQHATLQRGGGEDVEASSHGARSEPDDADSARRLREAKSLVLQQFADATRKRGEMFGKQPGLEAFEQPIEDQQCMQLLGVEPQSGKLERLAAAIAPVVVAAEFLVPRDRGVEAVPQNSDQTKDRLFVTSESFRQLSSRYGRASVARNAVKLVQAIELVHALRPRLRGQRCLCHAAISIEQHLPHAPHRP